MKCCSVGASMAGERLTRHSGKGVGNPSEGAPGMQAAASDTARLRQALADGQTAAAQRAALQAQADALQR